MSMRLSLCWIAVLGLSFVSEPAAAQERDFCASSLLGEAAPVDLVPSMLPSSPPQDPGEKAKEEDKEAPAALQKTSNDRILWTLPNFLTMENADSIPALSPGEKFKVTARGVFDPFEFVLVSFVAGLNQASDSNPTYGQGMQGYAKRYGTAYADNAIENFMASAVFPSVLRQDPRYYQLGQGGFLRRRGHAVSRVLI